jgi:glycosyltransferase involved in cell wall biosynthesis
VDLNPIKVLQNFIQKNHRKKYRSMTVQGFRVEVLPFLSSWHLRNLHSILTRTLYRFNVKKIEALFSAIPFDIIHAQFILPDALLANELGKRYGIPYVVTTHNEKFYFEHFFSNKLSVRLLREAAAVYPINHTNYRFYKSIDIKNVELIPLGFNDSFVRNQKSINKGTVMILTVCELIKLKNVDKVIQAVKLLSGKHDIHYTIIGKGEQKAELENLAVSLGLGSTVTFIDHIPYEEIAGEMYKHDIFIMPSYFETFGRVYFEAMAMGIPVVCAKNSGISGIFREYEEGISVDHRNIQEISEALEFLITHPEDRMRIGISGKRLVEQYTWTRIADKLHTEYEMILKKHKAS